jgi:hypothetical protein
MTSWSVFTAKEVVTGTQNSNHNAKDDGLYIRLLCWLSTLVSLEALIDTSFIFQANTTSKIKQ